MMGHSAIRVRTNRLLVLGHVGCETISIIVKGTTGTLVKSWGLRDEAAKLMQNLEDDGYQPISLEKFDRAVYAVVEWDATIEINTNEDADTDGEYEGEGRVRTDRDLNSSIPWHALEFEGLVTI